MSSKNIGWKTYSARTGELLDWGLFGGALDMTTANRLVSNHGIKVRVKRTGFNVFVDKHDREVHLLFNIDPRSTSAGIEANKQHAEEQRQREAESVRLFEEQMREISNLMDGLTNAEIIRRLKGE
jgi:hypothetical protein